MAKKPMTIDITNSMYPEQQKMTRAIFSGKYRMVSAVAGRRAGKSYVCDRVAIGLSLRLSNKEVLWTTPSHPQSQEAFDRIQSILNLVNIKYKSTNSPGDRKITFDNGSRIKFRSADRFDNLRGNNPDYVILDEFAFFKDDAWTKVIEPYGLSNKDIVFIAVSTYCGSDNDFYRCVEEGKSTDERYAKSISFRLHYSMNPKTNYEFIKEKKLSLPKAVFDQEYEGILVEGASIVFGDFSKNQTVTKFIDTTDRKTSSAYFYGIDVAGDGEDKTVLTIEDADGKVVLIYAIDKGSFPDQARELAPIIKSFPNITGYVEKNTEGFADVLFEQGVNGMKFHTSNPSKQKLVSSLIVSLYENDVNIPTPTLCPNLANEMMKYQAVRTKTGKIAYLHPSGGHDDYVDSLLLADYYRRTRGSISTTPLIDYRNKKRADDDDDYDDVDDYDDMW